MSWNLRQRDIFFTLVMLLWHCAAVILEIKEQLVSVGPLEAWDISTLTAPTSVGCNFLPSVPLPVHQRSLSMVKKKQQCVGRLLHRPFTWEAFAVHSFGIGTFSSPGPPQTCLFGLFHVTSFIVALEKVSSIASKCAALPAFEPLSLVTFCSGGRPHCRSVNGALCNRCLHIYFAE